MMTTTAGNDQGDNQVDGGAEGASMTLSPLTRLDLRERQKHNNQIVYGRGEMGGAARRWWSGGSGAKRWC
jgi:hypothetical protein